MSEQKPGREDEILEPSRFYQIGVVVKSIEETVKYYEKVFGFGPFEFVQVDFPTATYYGEVAGYRGKRAFFHLGPIEIELIELIDGKTIQEDFLKEKGEGLHHIGFEVSDLEDTLRGKTSLELAEKRAGKFDFSTNFPRIPRKSSLPDGVL